MVYSAQEKAKCVEWFIEEGKSVAKFGIRYRREQGRNSKVPNRAAIKDWYSKFKAEGDVKRKKKAGNNESRGVVGPFFFDENVNGANYLQMLQQFFLPHVQGFQGVIFMQDGAPPHWSPAVRNWLDENFTLRWMGRGTPASPAPFAWPPYSPDSTPCDFFLWGWIKSQVYTTPIANINELRTRIERAFVSLRQQMINRAIEACEKRLEYCVQVNGKSTEQEYE